MKVEKVEVDPKGAGKGFDLTFGFHVSHKDLQKQIFLTPGETIVLVNVDDYADMKSVYDAAPKAKKKKTTAKEVKKPTKAQASAWFKKHGGDMDLIGTQGV